MPQFLRWKNWPAIEKLWHGWIITSHGCRIETVGRVISITIIITKIRRYHDQSSYLKIGVLIHGKAFFTFGPRGRRARSARRPRGQNVAAIALDMGQAHLWYENNTMQTIHAIQTLRTVCGFLDMGDGCCLIFNKNQLMFIVRKSITAQIKKKIILFFS